MRQPLYQPPNSMDHTQETDQISVTEIQNFIIAKKRFLWNQLRSIRNRFRTLCQVALDSFQYCPSYYHVTCRWRAYIRGVFWCKVFEKFFVVFLSHGTFLPCTYRVIIYHFTSSSCSFRDSFYFVINVQRRNSVAVGR